VNGDGYGDVAVNAEYALNQTGRVHVYHGGASGLPATPTVSITGPDGAGARFGKLAGACDVNGDGFGDLIVGADFYANETGRIYVYRGGASGLATTPDVITGADGPSSGFARVVACAGDVNGDGYADVIVGQDMWNGTGKVHVFLGGATGLAAAPARTWADGTDTKSGYGCAVASAGDVNADGYGDVIVGERWTNQSTGRVFVYLGGSGGPQATATRIWIGPDGMQKEFGVQLGFAGDMNGDGVPELLVSAPYVAQSAGRVYVYSGSAPAPAVTWTGADIQGSLGKVLQR
jgi:hypothetical protein